MTGSSRARIGVAVALTVVLGTLAAPVVAGAAVAQRTAATPTVGSSPSLASVVGPGATWDGKGISSAGSPSSAFVLSKGQTATVAFTYTQGTGGAIANATLALTYLGIVLTTSTAATHITGGPPVSGAAQINWSFGPLYDALEGVFQLTASLLYPNGSHAWSESFYVFAKAPYLLESGAVVVLLILLIAELYWGFAAIRDARRGRKPAPPSASTPSPGPASSATTSANEPSPPPGGAASPPPASPPADGPGTPGGSS